MDAVTSKYLEQLKTCTDRYEKEVIVESALSHIETEEATKERRLSIITSDKKRLQEDICNTNKQIGFVYYELNKKTKELNSLLTQQDLYERVLARMDVAEQDPLSAKKFVDIRAEYEKPTKEIMLQDELKLNNDMVLGYLRETLPFDMFSQVSNVLKG